MAAQYPAAIRLERRADVPVVSFDNLRVGEWIIESIERSLPDWRMLGNGKGVGNLKRSLFNEMTSSTVPGGSCFRKVNDAKILLVNRCG